MIAVKGAPKRVAKCKGTRYAKALEAHERNEAKLARIMRAWDKSRALLRRLERDMDREWAAQEEGSPGEPEHDFDDDLPTSDNPPFG